MKIATIVGARPQFVKAAVVSRALQCLDGVREIVIHTGQHYDFRMSEIFFRELDIPEPAYHLGVGSAPHGAQTGRMLEAIEGVLVNESPDCTLIYGDTNSTLAGTLAAAKMHIPTAHVESGLRSFNRRMPEEINRIVADRLADLLFAPTQVAVDNLLAEGIRAESIHQVGDVMYDAALFYGDKAQRTSCVLETLGLEPRAYVLATFHRAENTDNPLCLRIICAALTQAASELAVVLPLHPRSRAVLERERLFDSLTGCLQIIEPIGYLDMLMLEKNARLIVTDSGGVQKEAFFYRIPCVTLRHETEWIELVELGWNRLAPPVSAHAVLRIVHEALKAPPGADATPYGDGHCAEGVARILRESFAPGTLTTGPSRPVPRGKLAVQCA